MRIQLTSISKLPAARRQLRRSGIRLTVRYGQVYTIRAIDGKQPDTPAQLRMRNIMAQATALAKKELATPDRKAYWTTQATLLGYKTARGACIAHHIKQLRESTSTPAQIADKTQTTDTPQLIIPTTHKPFTHYYISSIHPALPTPTQPPRRARWRKPLPRSVSQRILLTHSSLI